MLLSIFERKLVSKKFFNSLSSENTLIEDVLTYQEFCLSLLPLIPDCIPYYVIIILFIDLLFVIMVILFSTHK